MSEKDKKSEEELGHEASGVDESEGFGGQEADEVEHGGAEVAAVGEHDADLSGEEAVVKAYDEPEEEPEPVAAVGEEEEPKVVATAPTKKQHDSGRKGAVKSTVAKAAEKKPAKKAVAPAGSRSRTEVFATGGGALAPSAYLGKDDLDGLPLPSSKGPVIGIVVGTLVVLGLCALVLTQTAIGGDIQDVLRGEYRAKKEAEKKAREDALALEQEAKLPKYGTLMMDGQPKYASIKLGGQPLYGQTSSGYWREVQLIPGFSVISNLDIKEKQVVEVSAPGHSPKTVELTQGMWKGGAAGGTYQFPLTASLIPLSPQTQLEMDARMSADVEADYFGKIMLTSTPPGATVKINNAVLMNEKGEELKTPVSFEQYWVMGEKEGEKGKLEARPARVDTILDQGHKIEVTFPEQPTMPKFIMQLERQMWECEPKPEDEIKKLPKDHSPQLECNYVFKKNVDFGAIADFIKKQEAEKARVQRLNEEMKKARAAAEAKKGEMDEATREILEAR